MERLYPEARISLDFSTPWQCLAATILSAQCTDVRVNQVTPHLFRRYPDAPATARASLENLQELIVPTGFFRQKARALKGAARYLMRNFGGELPESMERLLEIPGVGRKTANVVIGHVFGRPGMVVDTHVKRVSRRLGLTRSEDPAAIERDLAGLVRPARWTPFSMGLILHGRRLCAARRPLCEECTIASDCLRRDAGPQVALKRRRRAGGERA